MKNIHFNYLLYRQVKNFKSYAFHLSLTKIYICIFFLIFIKFSAFSQFECGTDYIHQYRLATDPEYKRNIEKTESEIYQILQSREKSGLRSDEVYTIPIVVHVIHLGEPVGTGTNISDSTIHEAIRGLNDRFRSLHFNNNGVDIQIEFCLAKRDPNNQLTNGIVRKDGRQVNFYQSNGIKGENCGADQFKVKDLSKWSVKDYYNIWVVNKICGTLASGAGIAGYADFPSSDFNQYDGTVIRHDLMNYEGTTLTHELGHAFYLFHTHQGGCKNDFCEFDGDKICDTPPHNENNCGLNSSCGMFSNWDNSRFNLMSYCHSNGRRLFTPMQKDRMRAAAILSTRKSLILSKGCDVPIENDAGIVDILYPLKTTYLYGCEKLDSISPIITFKNLGQNNLTSATIQYKISNDTTYEYLWQGILLPNKETEMELPKIRINGESEYVLSVNIFLLNGQIGEVLLNETMQKSFKVIHIKPLSILHNQTSESCNSLKNGSIRLNSYYKRVNILEDFEDSTDWTIVNGNERNKWVVGNATSASGRNSIYVSSDGNPNIFDVTRSSIVHFFKDFYFPSNAKNIEIKFDWKNAHTFTGNFIYDFITLNILPSDFSENHVFSSSRITSNTHLFYYNQITFTNSKIIGLDSLAGKYKRIVFSWENDDRNGTQPPAAIDNIEISYDLVFNSEYEYIWQDFPDNKTNLITDVSAGIYKVTVIDNLGCSASIDAVIDAPEPIDTEIVKKDLNCVDENSGEITLTPLNGVAPISYVWSNNSVTNKIENLSAGKYTVTVSDSKNPISSKPITPSCIPGSTSPGFNIGIYSIQLKNINNSNNIVPNGYRDYTNYFTIIAPNGYHELKIQTGPTYSEKVLAWIDFNNNGMFEDDEIIMNSTNTIPDRYHISHFIVPDNAIRHVPLRLRVGSDISSGLNSFSGPCNSSRFGHIEDYTVFIGLAACSVKEIEILPYRIKKPEIQLVNNNSCLGSDVRLFVNVEGEYMWNNNQTTQIINVSESGTYIVTVMETNGCTAVSDSFEVILYAPGDTAPPAVTIIESSCENCTKKEGQILAPNYLCPTGYSLQYSIDGGFSWDFQIPLYDPKRVFTILTRCGCVAEPNFGGPTNSVTTQPEICSDTCLCLDFSASIIGMDDVCDDQLAILDASDGISFFWSTNETSKTIQVGPGSYFVTITNENGCSKEAIKIVNPLPVPNAFIFGEDEVCEGKTTFLTAFGGAVYSWNNLSDSQSIFVSAGSYIVTVTNEQGCSAIASKTIKLLESPKIEISGRNELCIGEITEIIASGGISFNWNNGENTASISVVAGTYSVTVTDEKECSASTDYTVTELPSPVASVTGKSVVCTNELTEITAQGGTLFKWSNGAETAGIIVSDGLYSVTVTNEEGCTASVSKIVGKAPDVVPVIAGISALCEGEITQITATGGQTYIWSNGQTNASISVGPGEYTVTVSNEFSCTASATKNISGKPKPVAAIAGSTSICSGQTASLTASGGVSYLWSTGAQTPSVQVSPTVNTTYRVTVTASNQCTDTAELDIKVNSDPVIASSDLRFSAITRNQMTLNWTKGDGVNQLVVVKANGPVLSNPVNGASYNPSQTFGSGSTIGIGEFVVYYGTGNNVTVTNLIPGQTYYYKIFEQGCNLKYFAGSGTANTASQVTGCFTPSTQATNITTLSMHTQRLVVGWSNGSGSKRIVKINTVNQFTNLIDGTDPVANAQYSGQGEQVVYNGTGNSVTVTGLQPTSSYWFKVYEVACDGSFTKYNNQNATDNPKSLKTRIVVPSIQSLTATQGSSGGLPFYMNTEIYGNNPPIVIYADLSGQVRFRLNASISDKWSYQLDNKQGQKVSDGYTHLNEILYGKLSQPVSISHNIMESVYTLPEQINESPFLPLKLRLLFDNGLIGIDFPVHIFKALGASLPVTYLTFTALHNESDKTNDLFWTTSREVNSDYFDVERMVNDRNFEWIGKVESQGINADQHTDYVFTDQKLSENGLYIYRLRQTDLDGRWVYSPTASVYVSRISRFRTLIYPNPARGRLTLQVSGDVGFSYGCEIYNSLGQLKHKIQTSQNDTGERHDELDISDWETGIYTVMLTLDGHRQVHKVIVVE